MLEISSVHNTRVKEVVTLLEKSRQRKKSGQFVAEGLNELRLCAGAGYRFRTVFFEPEIISEAEIVSYTGIQCDDWIAVSRPVMEKLSYRAGVKNAIAVVQARNTEPDSLKLPVNPLILVAEGVEKPGNLGALLRSADAAGVTAVFICDANTDIYHPNVIRSSVGCVFTVPVLTFTSVEAIQWLNKHHVSIFTTFMEDAGDMWHTDFSGPSAIVVGTESTGLTDTWKHSGGKNVLVPMQGRVDSLNVSAAATLLMFEASRQRARK